MVQVIEVDEKNRPVQQYKAEVTLPGDVITMNPGVPPLGSAAFDEWLKDWHAVNNDRRILATEVQG